jgi:hypothetical protein
MTRAQDWAAIRDAAITRFELLEPTTSDKSPVMYSYYLRGVARQAGWNDSRVATALAKVYALRNADGGWGLNRTFTGPGNVLNPADTTYTVTLADHVGPALLEARAAGLAVPLADIQTLVALIMTTQTCTFTTGKAIAYSRLPGQTGGNDDVTTTNGRNVHNVNAHAAMFLQRAQAAGGISYTGLNKRIIDITRFEVATYNPTTTWWPYKGTGSPSDTDHTASQADSMFTLAYPLASEVAYQILKDGRDDEAAARIAWARLAALPPGPGRVVDTTTQWLVLADQWMDEVAAFVTTASLGSCGQIACWAAKASEQAAVIL